MSKTEYMASMSDGISVAPLVQDQPTVSRPIASSRPAQNAKLWKRVFSFPVLLGTVIVGAAAVLAQTFFVDPDVWWHIKQGEDILSTHQVPTKDIYSLSLTGQSWTAYEWVGDVLLAAVHRVGGLPGLELLLLVLGGLILVAIYTLATIRSGNSKAAFVATMAVFVLATVSFNLRSQMLGYLFMILTLIVLERFRQGHRGALWSLPVLMLLWVNAHGSWVIGLGVIGIYLASGLVEFQLGDVGARRWSQSDRLRLAIVFVLSVGASLISPYGARLAKYPFDVAFSLPLGVANVQEWRPIPFNAAAGKLLLIFVLGFIVLQVVFHFSWRLEELLLLLFSTAAACMHLRFLLIFVPVFTPLLATILARWLPRYDRTKDRFLLNAVLMATLLAVIGRYFPSQAELLQNVGKTYPVAAVEYLNSHSVPGPMYNTYGFGGYLIFSQGPEHKVFMDGRSELYERGGVLADYLEIADIKPRAISMLQKYGFRSCLINHDEPLATLLAVLPDWRKEYEDGTSVLYVRRSAAFHGL